MFVLVRDPRAAARSQVRFLSRGGDGSEEPLEVHIERECVANFIPWLQGWINCAARSETPFRVHFLTFREVREDTAAVVRKICRVLENEYPAMSAYADRRTIEEVIIHFVTGTDDGWLSDVGEATRARLWEACTPEIKALLDLAP
jgi:Sulfotransferase domain